MRETADPDLVQLAIGRAIAATFDKGDWIELALRTGSRDRVEGHRRLLRSLDWRDDDYEGNIYEVLPAVLGDVGHGRSPYERFRHLRVVEERVGLEAWLAANEQHLHADLYGGGQELQALDRLRSTADEVGLNDVRAHAKRIERGLGEDLALAVGSAKELLETVLKHVLGLHGTGPETKLDLPALRKDADKKLGLDAKGSRSDEPGADQRRRLLGALAQIVTSAAELRNAGLGTGHGTLAASALDAATARLAVTAALAAATFYLEAEGPLGETARVDFDIPF